MRKILLSAAILWVALQSAQSLAATTATPTPGPDDRVLGKADAPVTIFEYASLTCPHCAEFDVETLPKLKAEWIDTGKARLIFRDYPLDQVALRAAILARCAPPDRFFAFIDALFHSQQNWVLASDQNTALGRIARLGGIGPDQFAQCMSDQKLADSVVAERLVATDQYGVDSTPTFFINGTKFVGAQPYDAFAKALSVASGETGNGTIVAPAPAAATPAAVTPTAATPAAPPGQTAPPAPAASTAAPPPAAAPAAAEPASGGWMQSMLATVKHFFGSP